MKHTLISFIVLLVAHSILSWAAFRHLARISPSTPLPKELASLPETTTPKQVLRGERSFVSPDTIVWKTFVPAPVLFYIWAGYLGLVAGLAVAWWRHSRLPI